MSFQSLPWMFFAVGYLAVFSTARGQANPEATNAARAFLNSPAPTAGSIEDLKRQAAAGDADAEQKLGAAYFYGQLVPQDYKQAFAWALKSAKQGNATAAMNVAYLYLAGQGTEKNPTLAFQWYLKLANEGLPRAQCCVADLYANGKGTTRDYPLAVAWYRKAAEGGDMGGESALGNAYTRGIVVPKDPKLAFEWFSKAAIQGNVEAKTRLGLAYLDGLGTPTDMKKGFTYLLSNSTADGNAAYWVANCYDQGIFVSRDPVLAYAWALRAATMTKRDELTQLLADLKSSLTSDDVQNAQKLLPDLAGQAESHVQSADEACVFANRKSSVIPFEEIGGLILIPVETKDKSPAFLTFDTGASSGLLFQDFAQSTGLKGNSYIPFTGIGEVVDLAMISDKTDFALPGMKFRNSRWILTPNYGLDANVGQPVVGVLGMDLVKDLVVRISFIEHTIEFIAPGNFKAPEDATSVPLMLNGSGPLVQATVINEGVEATGPFLVDTGSNGPIALSKNFQDLNPTLKIRGITSNGASGLGGTLYSSTGSCSSLVLGGLALPNAAVDLSANNQGTLMTLGGNIGNQIWWRFNIVFDFPHQKIYLQKNTHFDDPYTYATAGMHVVASGANYETLTVREIIPDGPGYQAGFQTGDVIVKVDELGNEPLTIANVYPLIHTPGTYHFQVQRDGQTVPLVLDLKDPLAAVGTKAGK